MVSFQKGDKIIDFIKEDYLGNKVSLSDYKGKKVLLIFFRGASCPFCNLRINQLIKNYPEFEKNNIEILTFFAATKDEIVQYAGTQKAPFAIIPDPNLEVYKKYGVEQSHSGMLKAMIKPIKMMKVMTSGYFNLKSVMERPIIPADFLINKDQTIHRAYYGKDFGDHLSVDEVLNWHE